MSRIPHPDAERLARIERENPHQYRFGRTLPRDGVPFVTEHDRLPAWRELRWPVLTILFVLAVLVFLGSEAWL